MNNVIKPSVWTENVGSRQAREVAQALKNEGYSTATINNCKGIVMEIGSYFEPGDIDARQRLFTIICEAAGLQPKRNFRIEQAARIRMDMFEFTPEELEFLYSYQSNKNELFKFLLTADEESIREWIEESNK